MTVTYHANGYFRMVDYAPRGTSGKKWVREISKNSDSYYVSESTLYLSKQFVGLQIQIMVAVSLNEILVLIGWW
jgi:hypothetical protein